MANHKIGYIRVSTYEQNPERQLDGIELDRTFIDKVSGKSTNRPQLAELKEYAREGDIIFVHSMDRLARNLDDLRKLVKEFTNRNITVKFINENLEFNNNDTPMSNLMLSIMGAFAEFERSLIKERQREGIELAKKKGVYKGRKKSLSYKQISELKERVSNNENKSKLAREYKISRETLYKYIK